MPTTRPVPVLQVRVIGADGHAQTITADLTTRARALLGPEHTYRTTTRPARRAGHIRVYLTIARKRNTTNDPHVG